MSPRAVSVLFLASCLTGISAAATAAAGPWMPAPGEYYSEIRATHGSADSRYGDDRSKAPLDSAAAAEERGLVSYNEIGWKKNLSLVLAIPALSRTLRSADLRRTATQTGLGDLVLGARYKLFQGPTALALEVDWKAPLGYDRDASPPLGQGQQDVSGSLLFGAPIAGRAFAEVAAGYRYRFEIPLDEIAFSGDVGVWLGPSVLASGFYSYRKSAGSGNGSGTEIELHRAGPQLTYRVDDRMDVFAGADYPLSGRNQLREDRYYLGVAVKHTSLNRLQGFLGGKQGP